jgi:hypothetical protein
MIEYINQFGDQIALNVGSADSKIPKRKSL